MPDQITDRYEARNIAEQNKLSRYVEETYRLFINEIAPLIASGAPDIVINARVDDLIREMRKDMSATFRQGIQRAWQLSNEKTFAFLDKRLKNTDIPDKVKAVFYDPNQKAMREFISRKENGLNLSDRVWRSIKGTKKIIRKTLSDGIYEGKNAGSVARKLRAELLNPTAKVSAGQGVYSSPIKNAMRVARTESNMAYRMADHNAWKGNPIILGYRISLSQTQAAKVKARCELCRQMEGDYPNDFVWRGWHPNCLCVKTPITMSREYLDRYNELIVTGRDTKANIEALRKRAGAIGSPPALLSQWVSTNRERVAGWSSRPYWWNDNKKFIDAIS